MKRIGKVKLGKKYTDKISGFEGIATARTEYMTGCARVCLEAMLGNDIKEFWFDETRLKDVKLKKKKPGGVGAVASSRDPKNLLS